MGNCGNYNLKYNLYFLHSKCQVGIVIRNLTTFRFDRTV